MIMINIIYNNDHNNSYYYDYSVTILLRLPQWCRKLFSPKRAPTWTSGMLPDQVAQPLTPGLHNKIPA